MWRKAEWGIGRMKNQLFPVEEEVGLVGDDFDFFLLAEEVEQWVALVA